MRGLGFSVQSQQTAWYADVLYRQEVHQLNRFPYFKPHILNLDTQASTSFPFPRYILIDFDLFLL